MPCPYNQILLFHSIPDWGEASPGDPSTSFRRADTQVRPYAKSLCFPISIFHFALFIFLSYPSVVIEYSLPISYPSSRFRGTTRKL